MVHRAGLRAQIISGGSIYVNDRGESQYQQRNGPLRQTVIYVINRT